MDGCSYTCLWTDFQELSASQNFREFTPYQIHSILKTLCLLIKIPESCSSLSVLFVCSLFLGVCSGSGRIPGFVPSGQQAGRPLTAPACPIGDAYMACGMVLWELPDLAPSCAMLTKLCSQLLNYYFLFMYMIVRTLLFLAQQSGSTFCLHAYISTTPTWCCFISVALLGIMSHNIIAVLINLYYTVYVHVFIGLNSGMISQKIHITLQTYLLAKKNSSGIV